MTNTTLHIIGAGLAGSEAAWQAAQAGVPVLLHEMRPATTTPAHKTAHCAELVCSNSFRSDDPENNAVGLLHEEMRRCGSLIMALGNEHRVPAGGAMAVDRDAFAESVTKALHDHPLITIEHGEITEIPADWAHVIIATGPLTSPALTAAIQDLTGSDALSFFDAIAPIVHKDSINFDIAWFQSRYDKGEGADYINCPLNKEEYEAFVAALIASEKIAFKDWEKDTPYFEGCMPVEVMAERGIETLRFGPLKPVGLTDPRTGKQPHAAVQLRQDNHLGTLYNMVGFQTKTSYGDQTKLFRMIPGLENAEFARLGGLHRNSFINSPELLDGQLRLKTQPAIRFAGQITGCEGYVESAAIGLLAGQLAAAKIKSENLSTPPHTTALGALLAHITGGHISDTKAKSFQPMNVNFGLFPPLDGKIKKKERKPALAARALSDLQDWLKTAV